ncbi:hypothetical protein AsAng_0036060 [Aureispira anguillae]|uniref:Uncharacterized protein n=1 Tax=Aureispira anguillae TaxID=2864201 RepID=A0A916DV84_9BACT|nr:hypothetical protein AsAng_0036060 [Aureispira anguillae]
MLKINSQNNSSFDLLNNNPTKIGNFRRFYYLCFMIFGNLQETQIKVR